MAASIDGGSVGIAVVDLAQAVRLARACSYATRKFTAQVQCRRQLTGMLNGRADSSLCCDRARCEPSLPRYRHRDLDSFRLAFSRSCAVPPDDCRGAHRTSFALPGRLYLAAQAPICSYATSSGLTFFL